MIEKNQTEKGDFSVRLHKIYRRMMLMLISAVLLTGCFRATVQADPAVFPGGQTIAQLHLEQNSSGKLIAAWIPYFTASALLQTEDAGAARAAVRAYVGQAKNFGITALFVHVCAFGESYYPSQYYPPAAEANGHDLMEMMTEACAENGIALHAWLNPLRLQAPEHMDRLTDDSRLSAWYRSPQTRAANFREWGGRYYLNPASLTTVNFLEGAIAELAERYHPAGIHIDDYFYPTDDRSFDSDDFTASGASELAAWRTENISRMVRRMCTAVHDADSRMIFSVSPQGNLPVNRQSLFADVERWCKEPGFCDLLIPQLYFGYQHEICPFEETAESWLSLPLDESVSMAVGLAAYKDGTTDLHAGSGKNEWKDDPEVLLREALAMLREPRCRGISLYHLDAVFSQESSAQHALKMLLHTVR